MTCPEEQVGFLNSDPQGGTILDSLLNGMGSSVSSVPFAVRRYDCTLIRIETQRSYYRPIDIILDFFGRYDATVFSSEGRD